MRRPRPAAVVLALSLTALGAAGVVTGASLVAAGSAPGVGGSVGARPSGPATTGVESATPTPYTRTPSSTSANAVGAPFRELSQASRGPVVPPVRVSIPALGVRSDVVPTGVDRDGTTQIPDDVDTLGWYRYGPAPRDSGSTVIVGHRDGRGQGRGALYALGALGVGDRILVTLADGSRVDYRVVAREVLAKRAVPLEDVFARSGARVLSLVSCGGVFDRARGGYQANVLVTAVPV
jgi:hypothetical protein